jgi:hypothetical protein
MISQWPRDVKLKEVGVPEGETGGWAKEQPPSNTTGMIIQSTMTFLTGDIYSPLLRTMKGLPEKMEAPSKRLKVWDFNGSILISQNQYWWSRYLWAKYPHSPLMSLNTIRQNKIVVNKSWAICNNWIAVKSKTA